MFQQTNELNAAKMNLGGACAPPAYPERHAVGLDANAPKIAPGPSVHGALGRLEESVDALQKVLAGLGERLQSGGVLSPIPNTGEATGANRPTVCGLEDRIVGIRMTIDRIAQVTATVTQSLQV